MTSISPGLVAAGESDASGVKRLLNSGNTYYQQPPGDATLSPEEMRRAKPMRIPGYSGPPARETPTPPASSGTPGVSPPSPGGPTATSGPVREAH